MLRLGIVGSGGMGSSHAHGTNLAAPRCSLAWVADVDGGRAGQLAGEVGCRAITDWTTGLDDVDAVTICTPHHLHAPQTIAALRAGGEGTARIIQIAHENSPRALKVEIEVESVDEARTAIDGGTDIVMLDNMSLDEITEAARIAKGRCLTEVSGGVTLDRVAEIAATGVDLISVGALTHSVKALDIGLDIEPVGVT